MDIRREIREDEAALAAWQCGLIERQRRVVLDGESSGEIEIRVANPLQSFRKAAANRASYNKAASLWTKSSPAHAGRCKGSRPFLLKPGDVFYIPMGVSHDGRNPSTGKAALLSTFVAEDGKPLATPVP